MKKLFFALLISGAAFTQSCNSNDNAGRKKDVTTETSNASGAEQPVEQVAPEKDASIVDAESRETKATAEMCDCINSSLRDMSPKVQQIIIRAGNSERPMQVLQNEIVTISDKEQEELFIQLQRFSTDPQLQNCSENIQKKYGISGEDKTSQEKVLQAAKNNPDCKVVYALIKIGMQQQSEAGAGN